VSASKEGGVEKGGRCEDGGRSIKKCWQKDDRHKQSVGGLGVGERENYLKKGASIQGVEKGGLKGEGGGAFWGKGSTETWQCRGGRGGRRSSTSNLEKKARADMKGRKEKFHHFLS